MDNQKISTPKISVCICTYRRPEGLSCTLRSLEESRLPLPDVEFVIVDNDASGSARSTVIERSSKLPGPVTFDIEPRSGVGHARNRCLALAKGQWIAFVDDDEVVSAEWLCRLWEVAVATQSDGVFGPVLAIVPSLPLWHRNSGFFSRHHGVTGELMDWRHCASGNVLIRRDLLVGLGGFDSEFAGSGAEDTDAFRRCINAGAKLVWCEEAVIEETVSAHRLTRRWAWLRSYLGGQNYARLLLRHDGRAAFARELLKGVAGVLFYFLPAIALVPVNSGAALKYQCRLAASVGKTVGWFASVQQYSGARARVNA